MTTLSFGNLRFSRRFVLPAALAAALGLTAFAVVADTTETPADSTAAPATTPGTAQAAPPADASARFRALVGATTGNLEGIARTQATAYERQAAAAERLKVRVDSMESAGQALFAEWETELAAYTSDSLRTQSRTRLDSARTVFAERIAVMRQAQEASAPALAQLHDRSLALNHALDARAVAALNGTATTFQTEAAQLQRSTEAATADATRALAGVR